MLGNIGKNRDPAALAYRKFVAEGIDFPSPWQHLKNQIFLCSDTFVEDIQCLMGNHYQLLIEASNSNLLKAMKFFSGGY